jgi:hypothetical protein
LELYYRLYRGATNQNVVDIVDAYVVALLEKCERHPVSWIDKDAPQVNAVRLKEVRRAVGGADAPA